MACCLFGTKPLPVPRLAYCQFNTWERITVKFEAEFYHFHLRKCIWISCLPKWGPFYPRGDDSNNIHPVRCMIYNQDIIDDAHMPFKIRACFQIKTVFFFVFSKCETVLSLYNGNSYIGKLTYLYWNSPNDTIMSCFKHTLTLTSGNKCITWANIDPAQCCHILSLGHTGLNCRSMKIQFRIFTIQTTYWQLNLDTL